MKRLNENGFSMIQVLIAIAVSCMLAAGIASMMSNQNKEAKALGEKVAIIDLSSLLMTTWTDPALCTGQLVGVTIDTTLLGSSTPPELPLTTIAGPVGTAIINVGDVVSPIAPGFKVSTMKVTRFTGSGDDFFATLQIDFQVSKTVRAHKPAMIRLKLRTDPLTPATAKAIVACGGANSTLTSVPNPPIAYPCTARRNSSCTINSAPGMRFCGLSKVLNQGCNTCAYLTCEITGPDATGVFTLVGRRGGDPDSVCEMTCF